MKFRTPLVHGDVTRLLMDFERNGDERWSRFSLTLPESTRIKIVDRHERPYRTLLKQRINEDLRRYQSVLHTMVRTHPELDGRVRMETTQGAVLAEKIARSWSLDLRTREIDASHMSDCVPSDLAKSLTDGYPPDQYAQLRLSVSQSFFLEGRPLRWETLKKILLETLSQAVENACADGKT
jgi:hypothetical protein